MRKPWMRGASDAQFWGAQAQDYADAGHAGLEGGGLGRVPLDAHWVHCGLADEGSQARRAVSALLK